MWDPTMDALGARYRLVRYDHAGVSTIAGLAGAALGLLDELELDRVTFCGLSLGGMVGMWLAAHAPERIERLVLCCTAPRLPPREAWQERADTVREHGVEAIADTVVARWFTERFRRGRPETVQRYRRMLVEIPAEGYARCCEAIRDADLRAEVEAIEAPTTIVLGRHDPVVGEDARRELARIRGARVVELDAAHLANVERPREFAEAVLG
jgi:3-oxoadipate enol-lactonase